MYKFRDLGQITRLCLSLLTRKMEMRILPLWAVACEMERLYST